MTDTLKIIGWPSVEPMIPLDDWLCERAANCERHAEKHTGMDRELWLQDAAYFKGAAALALTYKRLAEQLASCEKDAARYRWLKANHLQTGDDSWIRSGDDLEEAVDALMDPPAKSSGDPHDH